MRFSLIVTTIDRIAEIDRLLMSLQKQSYRDLEVIVVDQNKDDRISPIVSRHSAHLTITHLRSAKGASRGRNVGLEHARGDVIAFPDDDCWYPPGLLEQVARVFAVNANCDGVSGRPFGSERWSMRPKRISRFNVWTNAIEWGIFLRRTLTDAIGFYDESLGPGAGTPWGASEGTDYLIRALEAGFTVWYEPSIQIHHPYPPMEFATHLAKSHRYAMGKGRVLRLAGYPGWFIMYQWGRPVVGSVLMLVKAKWTEMRVRWAVIGGIWRGSRTRSNTGLSPKRLRSANIISNSIDAHDSAERTA